MADLAAGDVTYTVTKQRKEESGNKINIVTIVFGNGSLTYPSGGVPLTKASMGCPNNIASGVIMQGMSGDGIIYKYDFVNNKIRMYRSAGFTPVGTNDALTFTGSALGNHTHNILLKNAAVADGATTRVNAGANLLGANTGGDLTITGAGANGGVVNASAGTPAGTINTPAFTGTAVAAGNLIELVSASTAVASATTLYMEVIGW